MNLSDVIGTKNIEAFLVENMMETHYESEVENPPCLAEYEKIKYLQQTLK